MANKTLELWDGFTVTVNEQLMDDMDFVKDLNDAGRDNNFSEMITMYMALIGGEEIYQKIREKIEADQGYFSQKEFLKIVEKISDVLPKGGNRAQRRSWEKPSA